MFTGLVEEVGTVACLDRSAAGGQLTVSCELVRAESSIGDSIAVNGCCLTIAEAGDRSLRFDIVAETMRLTNLGSLRAGVGVNLERSLRADSRLGGHFVQGHIDGTASVVGAHAADNGVIIDLQVPAGLSKYLVKKGSVCLDGVSLTVADMAGDILRVWLVPHTRNVTTLSAWAPGAAVNLECDLLGKYVERLAAAHLAPNDAPYSADT